MSEQKLELGRQIAVLNRIFRTFLSHRMAALGLTVPHAPLLLMELFHSPGTSQDALASTLALEKTLVAKQCKELEQQGLIRRNVNPADRREYQLFLTDAGTALVPAIRSIYQDWNRRMIAGLTEQETAQLQALLSRAIASAMEG